jgi:sulfur-carrier protein
MARVRFFAQAREAAGCREAIVEAPTVGSVLSASVDRFGPSLGEVIASSTIWLNGEAADADAAVGPYDEVAVLPPVSGG